MPAPVLFPSIPSSNPSETPLRTYYKYIYICVCVYNIGSFSAELYYFSFLPFPIFSRAHFQKAFSPTTVTKRLSKRKTNVTYTHAQTYWKNLSISKFEIRLCRLNEYNGINISLFPGVLRETIYCSLYTRIVNKS